MQTLSRSIMDDLISRVSRGADELFVEDVRVGVFYTGVKLSSGHGGVAFTAVQEIPEAVCCPKSYGRMPDAGSIAGRSLREVLEYSRSRNPLRCSVGVAAVNAASHTPLFTETGRYNILYDADALDVVEVERSDRVTMVGAFTPYIKKLKGRVKTVNVYERSRRALEDEGLPPQPERPMKDALRKSDIAIITGSALVTRTLDELLGELDNAREVILVGPTASTLPDPLFERRVTVVGGVRIDDADRMLKVVGEAGSAYTLLKSCATKFVAKR